MSTASEREAEFDSWVTWPEWAKDAVHIDTQIMLSWGDRLRVLCGRRLELTTKTFTEHLPGRVHTLSRASVQPWRIRIVGGVVEAHGQPTR